MSINPFEGDSEVPVANDTYPDGQPVADGVTDVTSLRNNFMWPFGSGSDEPKTRNEFKAQQFSRAEKMAQEYARSNGVSVDEAYRVLHCRPTHADDNLYPEDSEQQPGFASRAFHWLCGDNF